MEVTNIETVEEKFISELRKSRHVELFKFYNLFSMLWLDDKNFMTKIIAQLQKWLMIKHNIFVGLYLVEAFQGGKLIDQPDVEGVEYHYYIWVNGIKIDTYGSCGSYDKVLNDGLYQALQLIKKEKK